jgi:hypothetical protein
MIRALLSLSAPLAVAALAAVPLAGAGILSGPAGDPIVVDTGPQHLRRASFDGHCGPLPLRGAATPDLLAESGVRVVALALSETGSGLSVAVREIPAGGSLTGATLILLLDPAGRVLFAGDAATFSAEVWRSGCTDTLAEKSPGAI